uniref:Poly [ADP-ribose] polymerase n=1 Tax=Panagrolaimus superbus TaxID=310955 RepID=A0A914YGL3_9BILA
MSEETPSKTDNQPPFGAEYAKSGRAKCKACQEGIKQGSLRMCTRTRSRFFDGLQDNWFHYECFWKRSKPDQLSEGNIRGMESLKWDDQEKIRQRIVEIKENATEAPTPKSHIPKVEVAKSGSGKCFQCKEKIAKGELRIQLKASNFHPACVKTMDIITGGAGSIEGYEFLEDEQKELLDGVFGKQPEKRKAPEEDTSATPAKKAKVDVDEGLKAKLKKQSEILWQVRKEITDNLSRDEIDTLLQANGRFRRKKEGPDAVNEQLTDCIVFGVPETCKECGNGTLFYSASRHTYKCYGHISEFTSCVHENRNPPRIPFKIPKDLKENNTFLADHKFPTLKERYYAPGSEVVGTTPGPSKPIDKIKRARRGVEKDSVANKKAIVKNGCTVDGNCDVAEIAHVFIDSDKTAWQASLGSTDIAQNRNSFYKIQVLKHDKKELYYLFRSWGRIGTTQGGNLTDYYDEDIESAKIEFKKLFLKQTNNEWEKREAFKKHPGMMNILEMELDGAGANESHSFDVKNSKSNLPMPIKELISTIFDVNTIKETLKSMDIDLTKMPLGKISKKHILKAMSVLTELANIIHDGASRTDILDASNRFYTLIPHACGSENPPLLNNDKIIHQKTNLLNDLRDIEVAYSILKSDEDSADKEVDTIDKHYEKLNCGIEVLPRDSSEYEIIETYAKKTHAPTHSSYTLEILDVFKVDRKKEDMRFKKEIGNRNLLWHGSRTSNYAGILSQGIYFADMVSKSANYCGANVTGGEGYLLLCEVALGEIQEEKNAKQIKKPKNDMSSVKGLGQIVPDEADRRIIEDGIVVPIGKPTKRKNASNCALMYNEYIVYDESQVKMKYLIKAKFNSII